MNLLIWAGASGVGAAATLLSSIAFHDLSTSERWELLSKELQRNTAHETTTDVLGGGLNDTQRRWVALRDELAAASSRAVTVDAVQLDRSLRNAAKFGHVDVVHALLEAGANPDAADPHGLTPLVLSAIYGHEHVTQALLAAGAHVNMRTQQGNTALHSAAKYGHSEVVRALIDAGADTTIQNEHGNTALVRASFYGHDDVVRIILGLEHETLTTRAGH